MVATSVATNAYNTYADFPRYPYKCIKYLMDNNELIWKLLKYNTLDAWDKPNLTRNEKAALIWNGSGTTDDYRVFIDDGAPDSETKEVSILRIYPFSLSPDNRTIGTVTIMMETYSHHSINSLSNYTTRTDTIIQQLLETFNGTVIDGIGRMHFDKRGTGASRLEIAGQLPFRGKWLLFGNKSA